MEEKVDCPDCTGSGQDWMDSSMACPLCNGEKKVTSDLAKAVTPSVLAVKELFGALDLDPKRPRT